MPYTASALPQSTSAVHLDISPIYKLNCDVLSLIFMDNTNVEGYFDYPTSDPATINVHPLNTARWTSQVCRKWRNIIIESPLIWANVIELGLLVQRTDNWRNHVLMRTGSASLCISGPVDFKNSISVSVFSRIVSILWPRIQKLEIEFHNGWPDSNSLQMMCRAPNLNHVRLWRLNDDPASKENGHQGIELSRELILPQSPTGSYVFPWTPQLHSLIIPANLSMTEVFSVLSNTPMLESLVVLSRYGSKIHSGVDRCLGRVVLPRLSCLRIQRCDFKTGLYLLENILPAPDCVLRFRTYDAEPDKLSIKNYDIETLSSIFKRYSTSHFNSGEVAHQKLTISHSQFTFYDQTPFNSAPLNQFFQIRINNTHGLPTSLYASLLGSLSSCKLSSITTLNIAVSPGMEHLLFPPEFMSYVSSCSNVQVIIIDKAAAKHILNIIKEQPGIFPALHTLKIGTPHYYSRKDMREYASTIVAIFKTRREAGIPLQTFESECWNNSESRGFMFEDINVRQKRARCSISTHPPATRVVCGGCAMARILELQGQSDRALQEFFRPMLSKLRLTTMSAALKKGGRLLKRLAPSWKKIVLK